jgi:N-acyl-D-amino-acid deacylase
VAVGKLDSTHDQRVIDATGPVISPGFIDMLGQSEGSLLIDNRSLSKLPQEITTEITREGGSIAPQNDATLASLKPMADHYQLKVDWTNGGLDFGPSPPAIGKSTSDRWSLML